jgi:DNA-binding CsgD family transcriptional regulator/GAF domain-containing protein
MGRLIAADAAEFLAVKALCYQGLDSVSLRERASERLARHLQAPSFCFGACDPATGLPVHSVTVGLAPESMDAFLRLVLAVPALEFGLWATRTGRVARLEELVEDAGNDPYTMEVLRPAGLQYEVQVACVSGRRSWGHLCLRHRREDGPFQGHELRLLAALAPHLAAGLLRTAAARAALAATPGTMTGVVVLGADGGVELANGVAQRLFARPTSGDRHSFLTAVHIVAARLEQALTTDGAATVPVLTVTDELHGEVYRLRAERVVGADGRPRGLVLIEPAPSLASADRTDALEQLGLTSREAAVAAAVLRGRTTIEIAAELIVSPHTVHDHLRKVVEKVGVSSRQQLAARLLGAA